MSGAGAVAAQLAAEGFVVCRGAVPKTLCASVRADAMSELGSLWWQPSYHVRRAGLTDGWKAIRNPLFRHAVPLCATASVRRALGDVARLLIDVGLPRTSQLVELSGAITYPGAAAQEEHTDISPAEPCVAAAGSTSAVAPLVTTWLAVQPVLRGAGPTVVVPGSHRRLAARSARIRREHDIDMQAKGELSMVSLEPDMEKAYDDMRAEEKRKALEEDIERELREFGPEPEPLDLLMESGDVAVMDCRVAHFGSAYPRSGSWLRSSAAASGGQAPRVLLNATFATAGAGGRALPGFTYHRTSDLICASLADLLRDAAAPTGTSHD